MSVAEQAWSKAAPLPPLPLHRLTVEQYHRMIETGVLTENDPVELLEGLLVSKMPHSPSHDGTISILLRRFWTKLPSKWIVRVQSAITLDDSEPEPDLAIVLGPEERYLPAHPTPQDILTLVEVADTTLLYDRNVKAVLYARARIPVYWIVNLVECTVEVYTDPKGGKAPAYRHREVYGLEQGVPLVIASKEVGRFAVRRLFS
jgi:Uma2 family endonuclease